MLSTRQDESRRMPSPARLAALLLCTSLQLVLVFDAAAQRQRSGPVDSDPGLCNEPAVRWASTRVIPAEEAFQAAAADEEFVYAISNRSIGKYSRETGQRVALSQGDAEHLNSGSFWNGRLYCAHSNYPLKPGRSQIKVLDVQSMQLSTFKDFGDFGGSLTWVLRHDGHWWCNFAYYGAENHRTVLVKFDDDWRERNRWTLPAELTDELGQYSLSGGIWRGDDLLVTGHDDPLLFRLRLPQQGDVLTCFDRQRVPFTGQGIANDPLTGGLVGIQRSTRSVVLAEERQRPLTLRVLSYNIHHGEGTDGQLDLERIAKVITSVDPDLVALQEVDRNVQRTSQVDQPAELARLTKMSVIFGDNISLQGGQYGNAILSRFPILDHQNHALPNFDGGEQRGVLEAEVQLPGSHPTLLFMATHLDHRRDDKERIASARAINERIEDRPGAVALLAGDLNDIPGSRTLVELGNHWSRANRAISPTIPVEEPTRQIDYILLRPADRWRVIQTRVLDEAVASDHRAILAVLELEAP